ncbi:MULTISPECIES: cytochrome P450 [Streptomyces]|uniref:Cytochrome P450 n=1 Tax=Streptomyces griseiscabiei TaxID=2993540 RepID=A0ABU4KYA4_9ACTN|nr:MULTISPECIES: cytochrome P450 [Streptomyces]MBZ3904627.1 cytochrome P450 [Streptomyces griseiscabiei]MDX2908376.1 cytochrome P450 [Streptomyces griseiscabiei]
MDLFRPLDDTTIDDPHPMYHRLRSAEPVHWYAPLSAWVVSGYDDCLFALHRTDLFSSDWRRAGIEIPDNLLSIQTLDPPEHGAVHRVLMDAYRRQDLTAMRARLERLADDLLEKLAVQPEFELIEAFTAPLSFAAVAELFGVPDADEKNIVAWSEAIVAAMDSGLTPEAAAPGTRARDALGAEISGWLDRRPDRGLLAELRRAEADRTISRDMILNTLRAMLHAGYAPTSRFIAASVLSLLRSPTAWSELRASGVTERAIKELLRHSGPVQAVARVCAEEVELGGNRLDKGSDVILLIAAANRDPERFPRPDELDLTRAAEHNLGFGRGAHACVGASLARLTCSVALDALLRHTPRLRQTGEPVHWRHATLRGLRRLPVSGGAG